MPNDADRAGTPAGVFGAELRFYRTRAGLSQKDLAAKVQRLARRDQQDRDGGAAPG